MFCERCGYSLHGLAQIRCASCRVLHFACPECGHHQPINTLRPAVQRMLGRLRAGGLALIVLFKINFFFWVLFGWAAFGSELGYSYRSNSYGSAEYGTAIYDFEVVLGVILFSTAFGAVGRMFLLRWRRGVLVGLTMGVLVSLAMVLGAHLELLWRSGRLPSPMTYDFCMYLFWAIAGAALGGWIAWGIWLGLVQLFLPKVAAAALLEWQRAMSANANQSVRTDATTSVTA